MEQSLIESHKLYCDQTAELKTNIEEAFITLGERLLQIRNEKIFEPHYDSFEDFVNEAMNMSLSSASKLINIFDKFILSYGMSKQELILVGQDRLKEILPAVHDQASAEEWVLKAKTLRFRDDLRKEVSAHRHGTDVPLSESCEHTEAYTLKVCRACNERWALPNN